MKIPYPYSDPVQMPGTGLPPETVLAKALPLLGTPGQEYTERRSVPVGIADISGVRFAPDFGGRPAVVVALRDRDGNLTSVHGRYLHTNRGQSKMLTVGRGGGAISFLEGGRRTPLSWWRGFSTGFHWPFADGNRLPPSVDRSLGCRRSAREGWFGRLSTPAGPGTPMRSTTRNG